MIRNPNAAGSQPVVAHNASFSYRNLSVLLNLRNNGLMPKAGLIWLGLGYLPPKRNAIALDPNQLPTDEECNSVAGLDVVLIFNGCLVKYGLLRRLCAALLAARPRRMLAIDLDYKNVAFLKVEAPYE